MKTIQCRCLVKYVPASSKTKMKADGTARKNFGKYLLTPVDGTILPEGARWHHEAVGQSAGFLALCETHILPKALIVFTSSQSEEIDENGKPYTNWDAQCLADVTASFDNAAGVFGDIFIGVTEEPTPKPVAPKFVAPKLEIISQVAIPDRVADAIPDAVADPF